MRRTRREFLQVAAAGSAAASVTTVLRAQTPSSRTVAPGDRLQIALIGAGGQGMGDTRVALRVPGVELVAVADIYDGRLARSKELWGQKVFTSRDHREVLARSDVDAVIIATPDHWHARIATDAMKAGKDVYVEKPMVQHVEEGVGLVSTERETKRIVQVGSQRVSSIIYAKARELYRSGVIGQLNLVEAWINRNSALGAWRSSIPPDASPQTIDWERFIGHAPKRAFEPIRLFRWRNYRDYGTGIPGDLFVHLFSGIHCVLSSNGPTRVFSTGGLRFWDDGRDVPDVMLGLYDYPKTDAHPAFTLALRVNFAEGAGESQAFRFVGPAGVITIGGTCGHAVAAAAREGTRLLDRHISGRRAGGISRAIPRKVPGAAGAPSWRGRGVHCSAGIHRCLRSLRELLRVGPDAKAVGRGRVVQSSRRGSGAAHERQLLRAAPCRVGSGGDEADRRRQRREAQVTRELFCFSQSSQ